MKNLLLIPVLVAVMLVGGTFQASADNGYRHDDRGYWDGHHRHHNYSYYHHQRGYWDERNGARIFINL